MINLSDVSIDDLRCLLNLKTLDKNVIRAELKRREDERNILLRQFENKYFIHRNEYGIKVIKTGTWNARGLDVEVIEFVTKSTNDENSIFSVEKRKSTWFESNLKYYGSHYTEITEDAFEVWVDKFKAIYSTCQSLNNLKTPL
jgi:hypothetical protein